MGFSICPLTLQSWRIQAAVWGVVSMGTHTMTWLTCVQVCNASGGGPGWSYLLREELKLKCRATVSSLLEADMSITWFWVAILIGWPYWSMFFHHKTARLLMLRGYVIIRHTFFFFFKGLGWLPWVLHKFPLIIATVYVLLCGAVCVCVCPGCVYGFEVCVMVVVWRNAK